MGNQPQLVKQNFGWLKRQWEDHDHLVIVGYNTYNSSVFTLGRRQVRDVLSSRGWFTPLSKTSGPERRARFVLKSMGLCRERTPSYDYVGSISVSKTALNHRHFVWVDVRYRPTASPAKTGYYEFKPENTSLVFSQFEAPIVANIISFKYDFELAKSLASMH